jgi:hypothetical protein
MTTTAVFPFDVAARNRMRSYRLSGRRDWADGTRRPSFGNSKREWGRRAGVAATTPGRSPAAGPHSGDSATNPGRRTWARSSWGRRRCGWFEQRHLPGRAWHRCFSRDTSRYRRIDDLVLGVHAEGRRGSEVEQKPHRLCPLRNRSTHQARGARLNLAYRLMVPARNGAARLRRGTITAVFRYFRDLCRRKQ